MPMCEISDGVRQHASEMILLNLKTKFENIEQLNQQALIDNQVHARMVNSLNLSTAQWAETNKIFAANGLLVAGQTGFTENQNQVTPSAQALKSTAEGSIAATNASTAVANTAIASSMGNTAIALANLITATGGTVTPVGLAALLTKIVAEAAPTSPQPSGQATNPTGTPKA